MKAVALYDFIGDPSADELSFHVGDVLEVTSTTSTDGWWEGRLAGRAGQTSANSGASGSLSPASPPVSGIFPQLYVQLLDSKFASALSRRGSVRNPAGQAAGGMGSAQGATAAGASSSSLASTAIGAASSSSLTAQTTRNTTLNVNTSSTQRPPTPPPLPHGLSHIMSSSVDGVADDEMTGKTDSFLHNPKLTRIPNPQLPNANASGNATSPASSLNTNKKPLASLPMIYGGDGGLTSLAAVASSSSVVTPASSGTASPVLPPKPRFGASGLSARPRTVHDDSASLCDFPPSGRDSSTMPRRFTVSTAIGGVHGGSIHGGNVCGKERPSSALLSVSPSTAGGGHRARARTLRKSFNRFSPFVRTGAEAFLLRRANDHDSQVHLVGDDDQVVIDGGASTGDFDEDVVTSAAPKWIVPARSTVKHRLTIPRTVEKPGILFTTTLYEIVDDATELTVLRSLSHFEWLHRILAAKFSTLCLPPLPTKSQTAHDGTLLDPSHPSAVADHHRRALERWLRRLARHPLVAGCEVFMAFVSMADDGQWKSARRAADVDVVRGDKFLQTVRVRNSSIAMDDGKIDAFPRALTRFLTMFGARVDALKSASEAMVRSGPAFRSAYARMSVMMRRLVQGKGGARASGLAPPTPAPDDDGDEDEGNATTHQWCWKDHCEECTSMTVSVEYMSDILKDVSGYWDVCSQKTTLPFMEKLAEYEGLLQSMQLAAKLHRATTDRYNDTQRLISTNAITEDLADTTLARLEVLHHVALAEAERFHTEKNADFRRMFAEFLDGQVEFHRQMAARLELARNAFHE